MRSFCLKEYCEVEKGDFTLLKVCFLSVVIFQTSHSLIFYELKVSVSCIVVIFFYHFLMLQNLFHVLLPFVFEENSSSSSIPVHFPPMYCHPQQMKCHLGSLQAGSGSGPASHLFLTSCCYRRVRPQGLLSKLCRSSLLYCVFLFYLD